MAEDTAVLTFSYSNELDLLKEAILHGNNLDVRDGRGRTGLHISAMRGAEEAVRVLLEAGAEANVADAQGNTPLHMCGHLEIVQQLMDFGAQVNVRNNHGDTPLVLMRRRGVSEDVIDLMQRYVDEEPIPIGIQNDHLTIQDPTLFTNRNIKLNSIERVRNIWFEFCNDLGLERLAVLLVGVLCLSLYVAYTITGYSKMIDTRIPVQFDSQRVEL